MINLPIKHKSYINLANNIFMNKFYKTSYPKTSSINQILKNKKEIKR